MWWAPINTVWILDIPSSRSIQGQGAEGAACRWDGWGTLLGSSLLSFLDFKDIIFAFAGLPVAASAAVISRRDILYRRGASELGRTVDKCWWLSLVNTVLLTSTLWVNPRWIGGQREKKQPNRCGWTQEQALLAGGYFIWCKMIVKWIVFVFYTL
jgi:hypothetical protein